MKQNGRRWVSIFCIIAFIMCMCGCGLSDWDVELLNGYGLMRINSSTIDITVFPDNESIEEYWEGSNIVIHNFFVTDVTISQPYIGIRGLKTTEKGIESKEELKTPVEQREHYLLDTENHQLFGPYDPEGYLEACKDKQVQYPEDWVSTQEMDYWGAEKILGEYWERRRG